MVVVKVVVAVKVVVMAKWGGVSKDVVGSMLVLVHWCIGALSK